MSQPRRGELVPFDLELEWMLWSTRHVWQFGMAAARAEPLVERADDRANSTDQESIVRVASTTTNGGANNGWLCSTVHRWGPVEYSITKRWGQQLQDQTEHYRYVVEQRPVWQFPRRGPQCAHRKFSTDVRHLQNLRGCGRCYSASPFSIFLKGRGESLNLK